MTRDRSRAIAVTVAVVAGVTSAACGDKATSQGAPAEQGSASAAAPGAAASATREMDEIVARVASGAPVDPVEAKDKALRDAKSFGVLGIDEGGKTGDAPRLTSAWSTADDVMKKPVPGAILGSTGSVVMKEIVVTPPSASLEEQARDRLQPKLELCWSDALEKDPSGKARYEVSSTVAPTGENKGLSFGKDPVPEKGLGACVAQAFKGTRFTMRDGAPETRIDVALAFESAASASSAEAATKGPRPTLGGKPVDEATSADVEKALVAAGCKSVTGEPKPKSKGARLFTATCEGKTFTVTFIPKSGRGDELDVDEVTRLVKVAALHRDGVFFLAVEADDKRAAEALLAKIVKTQ